MPVFKRVFSFRPKLTSKSEEGDVHSLAGAIDNADYGLISSSTTSTQTGTPPKLFGGPLDESDPSKVPQFILDTIDYLMKHGLETEGIFRLSTHETRKADLINKMNQRYATEKDPYRTVTFQYPNTSTDEIAFASAVLKHYFRSLPVPLIVPQLYETFMSTARCKDFNQEMSDMLRKAVSLLPSNNLLLLRKISELCNAISKYSSSNRMTCENLSVCWQPNILYNPSHDFMEQMKRTGDAQNVVATLFTDFALIFQAEKQKPISNSMQKKFFLGLASQTTEEGMAVYNGEKNERGEKHGHGLLMLPNGSVYEGEFLNNKYSKGKLIFVNGDQYEGCFKDDLPDDDKGVFRFLNSDVYTGTVRQGKVTGFGEFKYKDGSIYKGEVLDGKRHGKGLIEFYDGSHKVKYYDGDWKNNKCDGKGTLVNTQIQQVYTGEFKNGFYHGQGVLLSGLEQYRCEGEFENGLIKNGFGYFTSLDNEHVEYEGTWKVKLFTGKMRQFSIQTKTLEFEGEMVNSKRHGFGKIIYQDGSFYEGEFQENEMTGKGTFTEQDRSYTGQFLKSLFCGRGKLKSRYEGKEYLFEGEFKEHQPYNGKGSVLISAKTGDYLEGEFRDGQFFGKGRHTFDDGSYYEGDIRNSVCEGKGTVTYPDGSKYTGSFMNDERHGTGVLVMRDGDDTHNIMVSINQVWDNGKLVSQEIPESPSTMDEKEMIIFSYFDALQKEEPSRFGPLVGSDQRQHLSSALSRVKENPNTNIIFEIIYQLSKRAKH
ncbi:hypothetical protein FDP41_004539 [Naegleria fowleri]|uniref:Rho-GAP domain-containing protein n=1 Tax=Naegleria fowleri TaxID=5763 RepID=A0A6A5BS50_NAEFO|nr:uncharacterized protein FDP41_004539 [Naegleria fowleri]KAF0976640.1 hypothetical protein FDP41_004539 [Naegleria fowleri]CAG4712588.1 unnamed protein product [Naegleria fowleri]